MSQTFTSRPSRISRGRGADRGGLRGASTTSRVSNPGVGAQSIRTSVPVNRSRSTPHSMNQGSRFMQPGLHSTNNTRSGTRGRGRMDHTQNPNYGPNGGANGEEGRNGEAQQNDGDRSEQSAGGFTVIPRNERKWQKINQVASKETAEYERYKEANKVRSCNYVGTVGGGEISEDQARARQANEVRAAKFNRQMKQAEQRQATRKAEEDAIEAKRADARRKAELNAQRNARVAPAEEVRRNREAFLAQFENKSPGNPSTPSQQSYAEPMSSSPLKGTRTGQVRGNNSNNNAAKSMTPSQRSPGKISASPAARRSTQTRGTVAAGGRDFTDNQRRLRQAPVKSEPQVFQNRQSADAVAGLQASCEVKAEPNEDREDQYETYPNIMDEEIQILSSMYPDMETNYLADLLDQMGSIDGVIEALDFNG